jgi:hypothetical protein
VRQGPLKRKCDAVISPRLPGAKGTLRLAGLALPHGGRSSIEQVLRAAALSIPMLATATWRSGYATVCKTVYPGSIPGVASKPSSFGRQARQPHSSLRKVGGNLGLSKAFKAGPALLYATRARKLLLFPGSSVVEQPAVNRLVAGSNPARGAKRFQLLSGVTRIPKIQEKLLGATMGATSRKFRPDYN